MCLKFGQLIAIFEEFLIVLVFKVAEFCSKLPFSKIYLLTPDFWMVILYYALLVGIVYFFSKYKFKVLRFILGDGISRFSKKYWKKTVAGFVMVSLLINLVALIPQNLKIYFVDVGQRRLYSNKEYDWEKYSY